MKNKKQIFLIVGSIFVFLLAFSYSVVYIFNHSLVEEEKNPIDMDSLSILLETDEGSGEYITSENDSFPTSGYTFNKEKSTCENGSSLSWDYKNKTALVNTNASDKCYVYFDKGEPNIGKVCKNENMADCMTKNYTLDSTIIHHDGSIKSSDGTTVLDAEDNSYRYAGGIYKLNDNLAKDYISIYNGLINFYCGDGMPSLVGSNCADSYISYYYLANDPDTHYNTLAEAETVALERNYIERRNVNNYVCFGMEGESCDEEHLYRIIGLFDDEKDGNYNVKLMKNKSLGNMPFDSSGSNGWETSEINKNTLNGTYLTGLGDYANMIRDTKWNVGGYFNDETTAKMSYNMEKAVQASASKIGLMYSSDYGYATAEIMAWNESLNGYGISVIKEKNWMYTGNAMWTITPYDFRLATDGVMYVDLDGNMFNDYHNYDYGIHPVFYLKSSTRLISGDGSVEHPYIVGMN